MAGNHTLWNVVAISGISGITFKRNDSGNSILACRDISCFVYQNVTNMNIEGLTFRINLGITNIGSLALLINSSSNISVSNSTFKGGQKSSAIKLSAIVSINADVFITCCLFEENCWSFGDSE